jgi:RNAse (barnase) inhibitor barstar
MHDDALDSLRVDVASVSTREELHSVLSGAFGFPDYYGRDWDAFDECIRDVALPPHVEITGLASLHARLPRESELLERCVRDFAQEGGHDITTSTA